MPFASARGEGCCLDELVAHIAQRGASAADTAASQAFTRERGIGFGDVITTLDVASRAKAITVADDKMENGLVIEMFAMASVMQIP